jgi:oligoribonuclease (3'-5' exoribonuclease)
MVTIELGNQKKNCLVYVDPVTTEGRPKKGYIERINGGIIDSELSTAYVVRYIRKFVPA